MALDRSLREAHNAVQRAYYEERSAAENRRIAVRSTPYIRNHIERFIAFNDLGVDESLLDVGCGMGKYAIPLAERGYAVEALDISPGLLADLASAARGRASIPIHCADILEPNEILCGRFDVVAGFFMLHHLLDVGEALRNMRKRLKANGRVAFLDANPLCPLYYFQIAFTLGMSWKAERGIVNLTAKKLLAGLTAAGFRNCRIERFGILPPFLRSIRGGAAFEGLFDSMSVLMPVAAFQLISAEL